MTQKLITNNKKLHTIRQIEESLLETSNTAYYLFLADHINDLSNIDISENQEDTNLKIYNNLICGKRIKTTDLVELINYYPYQSNTIYDMYDHSDKYLMNKKFFTVVDEGSYNHVYKCLDNNNSLPSYSIPTFSHISGANTEIYRTSDGYVWKYMYSFDLTTKNKFATEDFIPVVANSVISSQAAETIDIIKVEGQGRKYDNYLTGVFSNFDLSIGGNSQVFQISNTVAKNSNGFYTDCLIYISAGIGVGQYRTITNYISNTTGKFITINNQFSTQPVNTTQYEINPSVKFKSSGSVSINAVARALVNAFSSNSIYRIELLNKGVGYDYFVEANVIANSSVGITSPAELKVILPPSGGHGKDAARELFSNKLEVSIKLSNSEFDTISTKNKFSQLGILKDPTFINVSIENSNASGVFSSDEKAFKISPYLIQSNITTNSLSNTINVNLDRFKNGLKTNDYVYINYQTQNKHQLLKLVSFSNSTSIQLNKNLILDTSNVAIYKANESTFGIISGTNTTFTTLKTINGILSSNDFVIGETSGAVTSVNSIFINDVQKGFDTFNGLKYLKGNVSSGTFSPNEIIYQTQLNNSNAVFHSLSNDNTKLYFSNQKEIFEADPFKLFTGQTSSAKFSAQFIKPADIKFGTGEILFIENISPISRSANTSEEFQIIFEY